MWANGKIGGYGHRVGDGHSIRLFLKNGNHVFGVEPNREMREAGEKLLRRYPDFTTVNGTAEETSLADGSVDFVTAGQAFHWFDREVARKEFARILKSNGWVALIWNERLTDTSPFLRAYEDLLQQYGTDYAAVDHRNVDTDAITAFFAPQPFTLREFRKPANLRLRRGEGPAAIVLLHTRAESSELSTHAQCVARTLRQAPERRESFLRLRHPAVPWSVSRST